MNNNPVSFISESTAQRCQAIQQGTPPLVRIVRSLRAALHVGSRYWCPICGLKTRKFRDAGSPRRRNAQCWRCGGLERHRLMALLFHEHSRLFPVSSNSCLLHIAPEKFISAIVSDQLRNYLTTDLLRRDVDFAASITNLALPDASIDALLCNHVLEHIPDDISALSELRRVLKPNGWALLSVPVKGDQTEEDPSVVDPELRKQLYGQEDHVRQYGLDFEYRIADANFEVKRLTTDIFSPEVLEHAGITDAAGDFYLATPRVESSLSKTIET